MADLIDELSGLDDKALAGKLGFEEKVKTFKADLEKASKLTGDARAKVLKQLDRMFAPDTWEVQDLGHTIKRAEKTETTPSDIAGCCCGMPGDYD